MLEELVHKKKTLAVIGLGYVGLPIALAFAKKIKVIGFDINQSRINMMQQHIDPSNELESSDFEHSDITFTANSEDLKKAEFFIVAVPTPIDDQKLPDLNPLLSATKTVGENLKKGDYVVYESTVYPGCTEEECVPLLEEVSGLTYNKDFKTGFSPERINPGDKEHTLAKIIKVVSGSDEESAEVIAGVYGLVVTAGIHKATSIKVAEAAKIIENTQRDLNIALMNELSIIFNKLNINTFDVLEAAGTKWNFLKFSPGLVGGHCIGVDPYYLTYKAKQLGHQPKVILSGREINDGMGAHVAKVVVKHLARVTSNLSEARVLVMGATFKENVQDIRNSKVADVIKELKSFSVNVDVVDPYALSHEVEEEYGYRLVDKPQNKYDAVVLAVNHTPYTSFEEKDVQDLLTANGLFVDIKGIYRHQFPNINYWSL